MRALLTASICLALAPAIALANAPAKGTRKPDDAAAVAKVDPSGRAALAAAEAAWRRGDFTEVRQLLDPIAADTTVTLEPSERQAVLVLLAEAALNDAAQDASERRGEATTHLDRLMDAFPEWRMPKDIYTPELYELYVDLRIQRAGRAGQECEASRIVCKSDLEGANAEITAQLRARAELQKRFDAQEVEVQEKVARSRALALIPLGIGHFYNGNPALGGSFLAAEVLLGAAGLGLIIQRNVVDGCRRTRGFQSGSLSCDLGGESDPAEIARRDDAIVKRRKGEEAVGWLLLGAVAVDIVVAQLLFQKYKTKTVKRVPRSQLEAGGGASPGRARGPRPTKPRARLRGAPTATPQGVGVSLHVTF
ncbi:MAG: hypothetical protein IPH07_04805 [Deltaproteobacteria bacterium]|nr:hypothetical protein [Deltaproteobacteria bacterium]MBK8237681.1 hypothetical protein [Deltaproteobacteria bacterium]MBP7290651.1 hypothetical protein [Nannocystaceae bacterium]